jgi:hypothetical protein
MLEHISIDYASWPELHSKWHFVAVTSLSPSLYLDRYCTLTKRRRGSYWVEPAELGQCVVHLGRR